MDQDEDVVELCRDIYEYTRGILQDEPPRQAWKVLTLTTHMLVCAFAKAHNIDAAKFMDDFVANLKNIPIYEEEEFNGE